MAWFIFIGDMLVMLFMTGLIIWVSAGATKATLDYSARIPLEPAGQPERTEAAPGGRPHG